MTTFDCLIPCRDRSKVTLGAVAESYGYNVLIEEGDNANGNRIKLFKRSEADYVIFCDDTDDEIYNIRKELTMTFEDNPAIDLIYFNFFDCNNLVYNYSGNPLEDVKFGASPWSMAFKREKLLPVIDNIFDPSLKEFHGSFAFLRSLKFLGSLRIMHRPYIGYNWNISPGGITDVASKNGTRALLREKYLNELEKYEKRGRVL